MNADLTACADAINLICGVKTRDNPENTVGLVSMASTQYVCD